MKITEVLKNAKTKMLVVVGSIGSYTANYTTADIDEIVADNLGTAGVELKNYMPLIMLGVVFLFLTGIIVKLRYAWR